ARSKGPHTSGGIALLAGDERLLQAMRHKLRIKPVGQKRRVPRMIAVSVGEKNSRQAESLWKNLAQGRLHSPPIRMRPRIDQNGVSVLMQQIGIHPRKVNERDAGEDIT